MPEFERYFAGVATEPATLPRAPVRQLADTGQGLEAEAMAETGGALTDISAILFKWYAREGNSQYDTARGEAQNLIGEFERTSYANADDHDKDFKKLMGSVKKLAPKNKVGARKFRAWSGLQKAKWDKISAEKKIRMIAQNNQVALFQNLSNVAKDYTDPAEAKARINTLVQGGLDDGSIKTANQAMTMRDKATENWLRADVWRRATAAIRADGEVDWSAAAKWFSKAENIEGVDSKVIDSLLEDARTQAGLQQKRDAEKLKAQQEKDRARIYNEIADGTVTRASIESTSLSEDEQQDKWELAQKVAKKPNIIEESDPRIEKDISDFIAFEPQLINSKYIRSFVGKGKNGGLSLAKAEDYEQKWLQAIDKNSAINTPLAKTYFQLLKETENDRVFSLDKIENSIRYGQALGKITDFFVDYRKKYDKDPSQQEVQAFYENLVSGYRKPESPFTEARVQQMLGELQSGGAVSIYGIVMPFTKPEDAINHALRTLGPDWQKIAPKAAQVIKQKWPDAKLKPTAVKPKVQFQLGERVMHSNGGTYEYTGELGDKAWKLVEE